MTPTGNPIKCSNGLGRILSIPTLFVALIVLSKFGFAPLNAQWHTVAIIVVIYLVFVPFVFHNAFYNTCKAKKELITLRSEIDAYLQSHRWNFEGISRSVGSVEHLFEAFETRLRNDHFAGVAAGVFPTLGILGTFISIAISMPNFSVETSEALEAEIAKLLGGVGTAFYASIYGIFLSLWWLFFEKSGLSRYDTMLVALRSETATKLWSENDLRLAEFKQRDTIRSATQSIVNTLSIEDHSLVAELREIQEGYSALNESVSKLSTGMNNQVERNLAHISAMSAHLESFTGLTKTLLQQFEQLSTAQQAQNDKQSQLQHHYERLLMLQEDFTSFSQAIAQSNADVLKQLQGFNVQDSIMALNDYNSIMNQGIEKLHRYTEALEAAQSSQKHAYDAQMQEGFELIDREVAHVIERLSEVALEITKTGSHIVNRFEHRS